MIDPFILLTPILLLGVIALLGFIGCNQIFGLTDVTLRVKLTGVVPSSGTPEGGTPVTIFGSGFQANTLVTFGAVVANITNLADNTINISTPAHPSGPVDVYVKNAEGNDATLPAGFTYSAVANLGTVSQTLGGGGMTTITVTLPAIPGTPKLLVLSVQWGSGGAAAVQSITGASFISLDQFSQNSLGVAQYYANGVDLTNALPISVTLSAPSNTEWNLLVTPYDFTSTSLAPDHPTKTPNGAGTALAISLQTPDLIAGDLIYSLAITRNAAAVLNGTLNPGANPAFTAEAGQNGHIMVQDYIVSSLDALTGSVSVTATNSTGAANSTWYLFAMRVHRD